MLEDLILWTKLGKKYLAWLFHFTACSLHHVNELLYISFLSDQPELDAHLSRVCVSWKVNIQMCSSMNKHKHGCMYAPHHSYSSTHASTHLRLRSVAKHECYSAAPVTQATDLLSKHKLCLWLITPSLEY